ncbi:hypothetical protein [Streptomyces sp. NBC_01244]|uniref:hypothetical protein n=1 Tax=Streptomyces sp. NBC_01244 TaxID=2903797 RepID=UPI002E102A4A|nr:hypothetical protein OG247_38595 [Streptomyces sp. NBC_01244]
MSNDHSATYYSSLFSMAMLSALGGVCVYFGVILELWWFYALAVPSACGVLGTGVHEWLKRPSRVGAGETPDA